MNAIPIIQFSETSDRDRILSAKYYIDDDVLQQEKQNLFFKQWQFACHAQSLQEPGAYQTVSIFDQNIIIVRTKSNEIKAFYNVCPHRGHQLVEGQGQKRAFVCPYHAWTYSLEGALLGARGVKKDTAVKI